jgi:hypothetical protein
MSKKIVTRAFKTSVIERFIASIGETIEDSVYYLFYGDPTSDGDTEEDILNIAESVRATRIEPYRKMIAGKRLTKENAFPMIRRYRWESNRVFQMYDDMNANLFSEPFFVTVESGEADDVHIFKCLFNNNNGLTNEEPNISTVIGNNDEYYETADGYQWKYMYSIPSFIFRNFRTEKFIPVVDYIPQGLASVGGKTITPGTIEVIRVDNPGANYNNYYPFGQLQGKFEDTTDIAIGAQGRIYAIRSPAIAENFYANTIITLLTGSGSGDGSFRKVVASKYNPVTNRVELTLNDAFEITPDTTTRFEISPEVRIFGNDSETVRATARAIINTTSNSINSVEVLNVGENYDFAIAEVLRGGVANSTGGTTGVVEPVAANVRPIVSPREGHGSNPAYELGATALGISVRLSNTEFETIPAENTFAQIGIVKNPNFVNIEILHNKISDNTAPGSDGDFIVGEQVIQFNKLPICGNVNVIVNTGDNTHQLKSPVDFNSINYDEIISPGDLIYIRDDRDLEQRHHIGEVLSVSSNTITLTGNPVWEENITDPYNPTIPSTIPNTQMFIVQPIARGTIRDVPGSRELVRLRDVNRPFEIGKIFIGTQSFSVATVTGIDTNNRFSGKQYTFSTYIQTTRCVGSTTGSFERDEFVEQFFPGQTRASYRAKLHSQPNSETILLTDTLGQINTTVPLLGANSGIQMNPNFVKFEGDLDAATGEIVFLENNIPVERSNTESEQIRIILEF